ncbi:Hypothetical predicted protein [Pelobates cultripes]|uniref:Uncharacterized protein n=1 Tax=Pelobates cultripes TaxID=61616 RepID=A0AAD1SHG9_PELCU|nr:Hypothetical predicted protein [Pelobates cultripes]
MLFRPNMVDIPDSEVGSTCSDIQQREHMDSQTASSVETVLRDAQAPATKQDIQKLLLNMRQMFTADLDLIKVEVQGVTARIQSSEEDNLDTRHEMSNMHETLHQVQSAQATMALKLDLTEDHSRRANLKIRCIPDTVDSNELPHYLRRVMAELLPSNQAKRVGFDGFFRIKKSAQASSAAP